MKHRTIRSTAQRQILVWLRHGPSTVSDIAKQFSMRMPHASLACRQLREAGLVTRDERGGLRNAPIYLSQLGHDRLEEDALGKMQQYAVELSASRHPMVLHADEANVLLAYMEPPESSFVFVGERTGGGSTSSSGNSGGAWVLAPRHAVKWYTVTDATASAPPAPREASTLAAFESTQQRIGLVRGVVLEQRGHRGLVEGQSFTMETGRGVDVPSVLSSGHVEIGTVPGLNGAYAPSNGLLAHLRSAAHRNLLIGNVVHGAIALSDGPVTSPVPLPFSVLHLWLQLKHPRMATARRKEHYRALVMELETDMEQDVSPLMRSLLLEFGEQQWTHDSLRPGWFNTHGVAERAVLAVLHHIMEDGRVPFVVDWAFEQPDVPVLSRWLTHPACRAVVTRHGGLPESKGSALLVDGQDLGTVEVQLSRSVKFDLNLHLDDREPMAHRQRMEAVPRNAEELLAASVGHPQRAFSSTFPDGLAGQRLSEALHLFPTGDEVKANALESTDALASWVASPPAHRPARWIRLRDRLPGGWVELMPVHDVPMADLPLALASGGRSWRRKALQRIHAEAAHDITTVLRWRQHLQHDEEHRFAVATCMLCSLNPSLPEHAALFDDASRVWFEAPMNEQEVLECIFGPSTTGHDGALLRRWMDRSMLQPKGSMLRAWATGLGIAERQEPWLPETQRALMGVLPPTWWSPFAQTWLTAQLASQTGRSWLAEFECSWPALLARGFGERSHFPGHAGEHPGFTLDSTSLLPVQLLPEGVGKAALTDMYAMVYALEQGAPVPVLSTHPSAGWLVRPVDQWPVFGRDVMTVGDPDIGEVLFTRSFHARHLRSRR